MTKPYIDPRRITERLNEMAIPQVDGIVAILRGGLVPAFLISHLSGGLPVKLLGLNLRDDANTAVHATPVVTVEADFSDWSSGSSILLVDDVSVSGRTMDRAKTFLTDFNVTTFALKGSADIVAFPEIEGCVRWPWNVYPESGQ